MKPREPRLEYQSFEKMKTIVTKMGIIERSLTVILELANEARFLIGLEKHAFFANSKNRRFCGSAMMIATHFLKPEPVQTDALAFIHRRGLL